MIIADETPKSNIEQWAQHKRFATIVAKHMRAAARPHDNLEGRSIRMANCAERIIYNIEPDGTMHYGGTWLCRDRLCPVCAWRLSIKRVGEMVATMARLAEEIPGAKAIHVCLTVRNCGGEELRDVINGLSEGFARLRRRSLWVDYIKGYMRSIEVSYNAEEETYHPHIHVIAIVGPGYTRQISMGDWVSMWRECANLEYNPIVWASHAYAKKPEVEPPRFAVYDLQADGPVASTEWEKSPDISAITEAIKYPLKPETLPKIAQNADIKTVAEALAGVRMIAFGGVVKKIRRELGFTDHDKPDELPETNINPGEMRPEFVLVYQWAANLRRYILTECGK